LGIWPAIPIIINYGSPWQSIRPNDEDNVVAALEHPDRVCFLLLSATGSQWEKLAKVMQEPFPMLTRLYIYSNIGSSPVLPGGFLGGSAPCLQEVTLSGISYPTLPTLLLSASDLVVLRLHRIPPPGYISPEEMVASLAAFPRLKQFIIEFQSATSRPDPICPPPVTRTVLPALTHFHFQGAGEYLEDLVGRIDGPRLIEITTIYFNQVVDSQIAQLPKFIDRSVGPKLNLLKHARVTFHRDRITFGMGHHYRPSLESLNCAPATTIIRCEGNNWQVPQIAQVLSHFSAILSNVVHLELDAVPQFEGKDDVELQHLLRHFSTVQTLRVPQELAGQVARALEDSIGEMVVEVLPSLDLIYLAGQPASSIKKFVAVRRRSGRPVTVVRKKMQFDQQLMSYVSK